MVNQRMSYLLINRPSAMIKTVISLTETFSMSKSTTASLKTLGYGVGLAFKRIEILLKLWNI